MLEVTPKFEFSKEWLIALIERVLKEVFAFIAKEEGWIAE